MEQPVASLNLPKRVLQELRTAGYVNCRDIKPDKYEYAPVLKEALKVPETKTALDLFEEECELGAIPTFITELDDALGGGIPIGLITEFSGYPDTCKTEIW